MKETKQKSSLRLDKYLADMGIGSRSQVKELIRKRQVTLNGTTVVQANQKVIPDFDLIEVNGKQIQYAAFVYYMLHKPAGIVTATKDMRERTVLDLITSKQRKDLFPVGRLDKDTEGLLLITNDGELSHQLLSPKKHVEKTYYARIKGILSKDAQEVFQNGLDIGDKKPTLPAKLEILSNYKQSSNSEDFASNEALSDNIILLDEKNSPLIISEVLVTIREGRYHQIRRMFQAIGSGVLYLKRISMGPLVLDETLAAGEYRSLTEPEIERLKNTNVTK